jgi:CCR4-NOT transcription complex subunit 3
MRPVQADKLDPKEQAKMESREWINDMVDRLNVRIEQFEYEMEELAANLKKKAKPPPKLVQVRPYGSVRSRTRYCTQRMCLCQWLSEEGQAATQAGAGAAPHGL